MQNNGERVHGKPVSVVIPAYNEEAAVREQVDNVRRVLNSHAVVHEIVVVDDGSQDRTVEEAIKSQARVLRHPANRGYGASLKTGILAAKYDTIVITDADGTYPAEEIPSLVAKLETADMVVGARTGAEVHIPFIRKPAKKILGWLAARISGQRIPDLNSGLRAFRRECVKQYFSILSNRFSFTTTVTMALLADDYLIAYHKINYYQRVGKSKIAPRNFLDFVILVIRMAMLFQPLRVFIPFVFVVALLGLIKLGWDIWASFLKHGWLGIALLSEPVVSTSAVLLLLGSFQLLLIGMVADGVIRRIARHSQPLVSSNGVGASEIATSQQFDQIITGAADRMTKRSIKQAS
jgi:glycosyltransferase involved in cell wall biosynthesis